MGISDTRRAPPPISYDEAMTLPNSVLRLFNLFQKKNVRRFCRSECISQSHLFEIIVACETGQLPWLHKLRYRYFVPPHLEPTAKDREAMLTDDLKVGDTIPDYLRRMTRIFDERRYLVGHIFYSADLSNWHLLYFDQRDLSTRNNHWAGGSHVHVVNWLTVRRDAKVVWEEFNAGKPHMSGLHVRCKRGV
ncbi:hypothetical protein SAMN05444161_3564 [Rhizobiales bacterium GAS191]|nr:hypothetical protein SAMN05444161_3564 [Rhizobiales bacterium GAS191]